MPSHKIGRITAAIRRLASHTIQHKMNDPRLGMVSLTEIKLSQDLSHCRIGLSILGTEAQKRTAFRAIESGRGYIQREVAAGLKTRTMPRLEFYVDDSVEKAFKIQALLDQTAREGGRLPSEEDPDALVRSDDGEVEAEDGEVEDDEAEAEDDDSDDEDDGEDGEEGDDDSDDSTDEAACP